MCPNQGVEGSLLPDCHIANRVFMYSVLHSMQAEERREEEVDAELRDRYEVFREVIHNFPIPLHARPEGAYEYDYVYDALQQQSQRGRQLSGAQSSTSMENNVSESSASLSSIVSSISDSSNLSARCDYYEDAVRSALAQLGGGGGGGGGSGSGLAQDKDFKEDKQLLDSSDETN
ncbi:hypothetical protein AWZ03_007907 [Drosophila navojoa]|uniref:Uncharacterized protein n=1 Tax=Drosophila navojoa TaxID=7232 RepID=A0A484BBF6_DRONA|nr:transcription initiation factor TFIID subunit 1 [Drosophila navojoa]TDG45632.1 hypothetical protein AWZ03_007907 [Drosophila navojoa]